MSVSVHGTNGITFNDGSTQNTRPAVGFRNRIINGDMRIWQRGTTISNPISSPNFYTADRWGCNRNSDVTGAVVSRIASGLTGFEYALASQRVAGNTSVAGISLWYSNESANTYDLAGSPVTLSFYAKTGTTYSGGSLAVAIYSGTGTDQRIYSYTGIVSVASTSQAITSTWTRYTLTGTVPANSTELGLQFTWTPTGTAGADDSIKITGVQLEAGSNASDFERRPIGTELALCQRYYDKSYSTDVAPGTSTFNGIVVGSNEMYAGQWYPAGGSVKFTTEMRRVPDFAYYDGAGTISRMTTFWNNGTVSGQNPPIVVYVGTKAISIRQTASIGSGVPLMLHYTADAEL